MADAGRGGRRDSGGYPHMDPFSTPSPQDRAAVSRAMRRTATEAFAERRVTTLSGGERARIALARALATEAPVLLAMSPPLRSIRVTSWW